MSDHESKRAGFHDQRNAATRIDVFEELSPTSEAALREFFRNLGVPHYVDEVVIPTLRIGDARVFCTVRDRPWPPWGLGARAISAYCEVHAVAPDSWAITPVYLALDEATNVGLAGALYREVLESLAVSETAELSYLVVEGSVLVDHVLRSLGFHRDDDVFLTEQARYFTYRAPVGQVLAALHLDRTSTPDMLSHTVSTDALTLNSLFHQTLQNAGRPEAMLGRVVTELLHLPRGGHASKPGGVPGGSGTNRVVDPLRERGGPLPYVALGSFLSGPRPDLLEGVLEREAQFRTATILPEGAKEPIVDDQLRRASVLTDVNFVADEFIEQLKGALEPALRRIGLGAFPVGEIELQVTASGDGAYYRVHRDSDDGSTRALTFVYFFHREPRSFSGGELRLFDDRGVSDRAFADNSQLLSPRQDTLVMFPSHIPHELLPVRVPSKEFADSRFTINGWIHRAR